MRPTIRDIAVVRFVPEGDVLVIGRIGRTKVEDAPENGQRSTERQRPPEAIPVRDNVDDVVPRTKSDQA